MLRITFHQFRCWDNLVIEAPIGSITLIKGYSGVGKTTILQGITWCLYGKGVHIAPNYLEKAKTKVIIDMPYNRNGLPSNLSINRQKNPNRLLLSQGGEVYEDKVAQALIDDMFGTYDIWLASCYIGQGCRNTFLTAPNTGKMELLNIIAFHEEDPTSYIERIDTVITETDSDYKSKLTLFTNNLNYYESMVSSVDTTKALTSDQISSVNQQILDITQERNRLQTLKIQRDVNIGMLNSLEHQLTQTLINLTSCNSRKQEPDSLLININNKYEGYPLDNSDNISSNIDHAINIIPLLQRREDLRSEIAKFDNQLLPYVNFNDPNIYTQSDYQNALSQETTYRDNQRLAQSLGVLYSEQSIKDKIKYHRDILSSQERLSLEHQYTSLLNTINMLELKYSQQTTPLVFPDIIPEQIIPPDYSKYNTESLSVEVNELSKKQGSIQAHIQHLQKGHDVLQCPHCKGSVRYLQGTLIGADTEPTNRNDIISAQHELTFINSEISRVNKTIQTLIANETAERTSYERSLLLEQRRIDSLKEKVRQLELEKQRRDIANQSQLAQIQEHKQQFQLLSDKLNSLPPCPGDKRLLTPKEIDQTHSIIARLETINILSAPSVSSQHIQSSLTYRTLLNQHLLAQNNYNVHIETIPVPFRYESSSSVQSYIDNLRIYSNQIKEITAERTRLNQLKISLEDQIAILNSKIGIDPIPEITSLNNQITNLQDSLVLSSKAHQAIQYYSQITKEREEVVAINNTLSDLHLLRQYAVDTECRILQQVVDSINTSIDGVCSTLFDRDINITLSLFKTLKTTKHVKPVVNFSISYQGGVFDNINQMSGGEGDRASLALTLALNRLSSCPILMLDESLASLDINMKEAAIRAIRENTNNTVLVIMHDGIEGIFDNIIDLSEIRDSHPIS